MPLKSGSRGEVTQVLDASAILAFLHNESGADQVQQALDSACISAVNWAEVVQKSISQGVEVVGMQEGFSEVGVIFEPFSPSQAELAARLWKKTRCYGLSLADRACLALAIERGLPVLTADRAWAKLALNIKIELIR